MKSKAEKHIVRNEKEKVQLSVLWAHLASAVLCVAAAVIICSCCALVDTIIQLNGQARAFNNGADFQADKIRIYIDQGHNPIPYHNTGAAGNGLYEQDLTFSIGSLLAELLREDRRFEVSLSRPDASTVLGTDQISSLKARVDGAAEFDADYFISLHVNAYTQDTANGIEVYTSKKSGKAHVLGISLLQGMIDSTGLRNRGMKKNSDLYVLKNATMPAVLLEMGFISNMEDAKLLAEHPELFAQGIYDGILDYFESAHISIVNILQWTLVHR